MQLRHLWLHINMQSTKQGDKFTRAGDKIQGNELKWITESTIHTYVPVFALQLSDELPLLFVYVKVDAAVWYYLTDTQTITGGDRRLMDNLSSDRFNKISVKRRGFKNNKHEFAIAAEANASHKSLQLVDELWRGPGLKCRARAIHDQWKCVCMCVHFSSKFAHVTWIHSEIMHLFVTSPSHCHAPFLSDAPHRPTYMISSKSALCWLSHYFPLERAAASD